MKRMVIYLCAGLLFCGGCLHPEVRQARAIEAAKTEIIRRDISFYYEPCYSACRYNGLWLVEVEEPVKWGKAFLSAIDDSMRVQCLVQTSPREVMNPFKRLTATRDFWDVMGDLLEEGKDWPRGYLPNRNFKNSSLVTKHQGIDEVLREKGIAGETEKKIWALRQACASRCTRESYVHNLLQWVKKGDSGAWLEYLFGPAHSWGKLGKWVGWYFEFSDLSMAAIMDEHERTVRVEYVSPLPLTPQDDGRPKP